MDRSKYVPTTDIMFKFIFGRNESKNITLSFLNAVLGLEGKDELTQIEFLDRELDPQQEHGKLSKLDIFAVTDGGVQVNIEMQVINYHNMDRRTLYYWARMYGQGIEEGEDYLDLCKTISINILDFELLPQETAHNVYGVYDIVSKHKLSEDLEIHFIEIPKLKFTTVKELKRIDRWIAYFSKKLTDTDREELGKVDMAIAQAFKAETVFTQSDYERRAYNQRLKAILDYNSGLSAAKREGIAEGFRDGEAKGFRDGEAKGKAEGFRDGKAEGVVYMLKVAELIKAGQSDAEIARVLDVPGEQITSMRAVLER